MRKATIPILAAIFIFAMLLVIGCDKGLSQNRSQEWEKKSGKDLTFPATPQEEKKEKKSLKELLVERLKKGEAIVWHLGHSGFAVKTENFFLIFDYASAGSEGGLDSGEINPSEIKDLDVLVFISHTHFDHFNPAIASWKQTVKKITYVISEVKGKYNKEFKEQVKDNLIELKYNDKTIHHGVVVVGTEGVVWRGSVPRIPYHVAEIRTIEATDDGVGFVVKVDGLTIFHSGDHALWGSGSKNLFEKGIEEVAKETTDIAFLPIAGGRKEVEAADAGAKFAIEKIKPKVAIPMHAPYEEVGKFVKKTKINEKVKSSVVALKKGKACFYKDGKLEE